jgi:hypothetical protein
MEGLSEADLWQKFYELSLEMKRFLEENDTDMFLELLKQRGEFEKVILARKREFSKSDKGQELIKKIAAVNKELIARGERWLNNSRRGFSISNQYELLGFDTRGSRLDGRG